MGCNNKCTLDFDNAPCIPIIAKTDTSIELSLFYPDPIDLSTGSFLFTLSKDERGDCPVLTVVEGDGLTVAADTLDGDSGYTLSLFIAKDHGLAWGDYYGEARNDVDATTGNVILKVSLHLESSIARLS